jgi:uridine kinase
LVQLPTQHYVYFTKRGVMAQSHRERIKPAKSRTFVRVTFEDSNTVYSAPVGATIEDFFAVARPELVPPVRQPDHSTEKTVVAAICNGTLRELTYAIKTDSNVKPITLSSTDGMRIYQRSLAYILRAAAHNLFGDTRLALNHALPFGALYGTVTNGPPLTLDQIEQLKTATQELIESDLPIKRAEVPLKEAIALFEAHQDDDKLRLLESREKDYLTLYTLGDVQDYFFGYMVPSTSYITLWDIEPTEGGFLLRYPRPDTATVLQRVSDVSKLQSLFIENTKLLDLLGVNDIGDLNQSTHYGRARELILVTEALHEGRIVDIAEKIVSRQPDVQLVLIAGPSCSGKTTFSKRLAVQLMAHGFKPFTLGMDNYFVGPDQTPLGEDGEIDFEHIEAIDLAFFNQQLLSLMAGDKVTLPTYNFYTGKRELGDTVQLTTEHIIIVEGIHGMNPELVSKIPPQRIFRIYLSALPQLKIDRYNRVSSTDLRLLRRMVRDAAFRGYSAMDTLGRWESVRRGEKRWIFPYQENADVMANSSLVYELAVLKPLAEPLLRQVDPGSLLYMEAKRLLSFLGWVKSLDPELVPDNSLLREFVGGSILRDYEPGFPDKHGTGH